ncbi:MAG: hypothetical protein AB8B91_13565 [Rubripirellula sp.]
MQTRFPFRYGIAELTELPHLFVEGEVEIDGKRSAGIAADGLPPKWFTKNAGTRFDQDDLPSMQRVIRHAAEVAISMPAKPNAFAWWQELYATQREWAREQRIAPLLAGLGVSLMERVVIDAVCREQSVSFWDAIRSGLLGLEVAGGVLPSRPLSQVFLRHTVGLSDSLTADEIEANERVSDSLPHALEDCIDRDGLKYFKIKLSGQIAQDQQRLSQLAALLRAKVGPEMRFTLDGNEQYADIDSFQEAWLTLRSDPSIRQLFDDALLFVEQPLHRDHALDPAVKDALANWNAAPPMIIDESDATLDSLSTALDLGYGGTSHKNCKGIFKSIAAATKIRQNSTPERPLILSAEDLANVGPVALLQDLAVVAALGIEHVERNGHHYFAGLSMHSTAIQQQMVEDHADLYQMTDQNFAALRPTAGRLRLDSVNQAAFGLSRLPDLSSYETWDF